MQRINWNEDYSTRKSSGGAKWYWQNGLEYDLKGNAMDKKAVRVKVAALAAASQAEADKALEVAKNLQAQADADQELLDAPDSPQTVAALKVALDEMSVSYPSNAKKPELEQLWVDAQAA